MLEYQKLLTENRSAKNAMLPWKRDTYCPPKSYRVIAEVDFAFLTSVCISFFSDPAVQCL